MPKRLFYILTLIVILLACAAPPRPTSPLPPTQSSAPSFNQIQQHFKICQDALPSGLYIDRLWVKLDRGPRTCREKINDLESDIFSLQSELDDLKRECSD